MNQVDNQSAVADPVIIDQAPTISLTESAATRVATQLAAHDALGLRLGAVESGCSGYKYALDFARQVEADDLVFESFGVKVIIDQNSLAILGGTEIDYVAEGLNQTFKFNNPKATDECGCGESFAVNS